MSKLYFIATKHPEYAVEVFPQDSVVIDPWRYIRSRYGISVRRIGENKPEMISLLAPTRGRPEQFAEMVESAFSTATHVKRVEVIAYRDVDDESEYAERKGVSWVRADRCLLSEAWNRCQRASTADIFMHCGDDIIFRTPGWDSAVREAFARSADKLVLVHGDDCSPNTDVLATHGFYHRRWVETLGYFMPPYFSCDWNDVWLTELADAVGRRIKIPIVTEHMHHSFDKREYDETDLEREQRGREDDVVRIYKDKAIERKADAKRLAAAMS